MSLQLLTLLLALGADEIPTAKAAIIARDQAKAQAEVQAKYGDKKPSELSQEERRQMVKDQTAADREVLDKHNVDPKQWAREQMKRDRADYAAAKEASKELAEKDKAAAEAAKKAANEPKEIVIQRGGGEGNPVTLEEKAPEDGTIPVEKGLPPEENAEMEAAMNGDLMQQAADAPAAKSSKGGKGGKRR